MKFFPVIFSAVALFMAGGFEVQAAVSQIQSALDLVADANRLEEQGEEEAAYDRLNRAESMAGEVPAVAYAVAGGFRQLGFTYRAASLYFRAALDGVGAGSGSPLGSGELRHIAPHLALPAGYGAAMSAGRYDDAKRLCPWWPVAYWGAAMNHLIAGRRADAVQNFAAFLFAMDVSGESGRHREWLIEATQDREETLLTETSFLVKAGFLASDWEQRVTEQGARQGADAFKQLDPGLWDLAGQAMRYTMRFKTVAVASDGTGEYRSIAQAIDALSRSGGGGCIVVAPGTYREAISVENTARIVIKARRPGSVVLVNPGRGPGVQIRGCSNVVIDGLQLQTTPGIGINVEGSSRVTLKNLGLSGNQSTAFFIADTKDIYLWRISGGGTESGLALQRAQGQLDESEIKAGTQGAVVALISSDWYISSSVLEGGQNGIVASRGTNGRDPHLAVEYSKVTNSEGYGILINPGAQVGVDFTTITNHRLGGILSQQSKLLVEKCTFKGYGVTGIALQAGSTGDLNENLFEGGVCGLTAAASTLNAAHNELRGSEIGVQVIDSSADIGDNTIEAQSKAGIFLSTPRAGWTLRNNSISRCATGIVGEFVGPAGGDGSIENNLVVRNKVGIALTAQARSGSSSPGVRITNATLAYNDNIGLLVAAGGPRVQCDRSIIAFNGGGVGDGARLVSISGSVAHGNKYWAVNANGPQPAGLRDVDPKFRNAEKDDFSLARTSELFNAPIGASIR